MKRTHLILLVVSAFAGLLPQAMAQVTITLGSAASYGVLAGSTVTNTGSTTVSGDLGAISTVTGFPPGVVVNGANYPGLSVSNQFKTDAVTAYNVLSGESTTVDLSDHDLGGMTLTTGVYSFSATAGLTGALILDAAGNPNARFDFRIGSTLGTAASSQITLIHGALANNVYWQVGSSATLGSSSVFVGNILALTSITLTAGAPGTTVDGRLLALNGAVTLDSNSITVPTAVPEPATTALIAAFGALGLAVWRRRRVAS